MAFISQDGVVTAARTETTMVTVKDGSREIRTESRDLREKEEGVIDGVDASDAVMGRVGERDSRLVD